MPFFSFTSERGSTCTNNFTGYTCIRSPWPTSSSSATSTCPTTPGCSAAPTIAPTTTVLEALLEVPRARRGRAEEPERELRPLREGPPVAVDTTRADQGLRAGQRRHRPGVRRAAQPALHHRHRRTQGRAPGSSRCRSSRADTRSSWRLATPLRSGSVPSSRRGVPQWREGCASIQILRSAGRTRRGASLDTATARSTARTISARRCPRRSRRRGSSPTTSGRAARGRPPRSGASRPALRSSAELRARRRPGHR